MDWIEKREDHLPELMFETPDGKHYVGSAPADPFDRAIKRRVVTTVTREVLGPYPDLGTLVLAEGDFVHTVMRSDPKYGPWVAAE